MSNIKVVAALEIELQHYFEENLFHVFYSGLGKINAAHCVTSIILQTSPTHIINVGTAGSSRYAAGTIIECSGTVQRDMDVSPLGFQMGQTPFDEIDGLIEIPTYLDELPHGICGTGDSFEIAVSRVACDLVDMEAYAIAKVCKKMGIGCSLLKYITDGSDDTANTDWNENLVHAGPKLFEIFKRLSAVISSDGK